MDSNINELTNVIRNYVDSKEFEYKFKTWTHKSCREIMASYWKLIATISGGFVVIIAMLMSFIFNHFNHFEYYKINIKSKIKINF